MIAYKFRSSSQLHFALDILYNRRLYCADWSKLNDPMEGAFAIGSTVDAKDPAEAIAEIIREKLRLRVCSLSATFDSHLLWAHYAEGFAGMAIEVDLPAHSPVVKTIEYRGVFAYLQHGAHSPPDAATQILSSKYEAWSYEQEVRILQSNTWFKLDAPIRRVIVGHRMDSSVFKTLRIVCERLNIAIKRIGIGDEGLDADNVDPLQPSDLSGFDSDT